MPVVHNCYCDSLEMRMKTSWMMTMTMMTMRLCLSRRWLCFDWSSASSWECSWARDEDDDVDLADTVSNYCLIGRDFRPRRFLLLLLLLSSWNCVAFLAVTLICILNIAMIYLKMIATTAWVQWCGMMRGWRCLLYVWVFFFKLHFFIKQKIISSRVVIFKRKQMYVLGILIEPFI